MSRSRTWIAASKSTRLSIEYSIDCGQVVGQRLDPDGLDAVEQRAAVGRRPRGRADRDERHVDRELLGHPDEEQVDVERPARDRVDLDAVDEDRLGLLAVDRQVDEGVLAGLAAQQLELVGVDGDARRIEAVAEDDAGQAAVAAEAGDLLADDVAGLRGERGAGWTWRWPSGRTSGEASSEAGATRPAAYVAGAPGNGAHLITVAPIEPVRALPIDPV